ncbi:cupin domain-containing protein [Fretibacter rubidus]|uniref:cupin domain-containing protein n=1 Tax=Fretibacter rubidus TaxID=570162 RepID=UPI00352B049A
MTMSALRSPSTAVDSLDDFANGRLSVAKHLMLVCQSEISPDIAQEIAFTEEVSASLMMDSPHSRSLTPEFIGNVLAALPEVRAGVISRNDNQNPRLSMAPPTLRDILGHGLRDMKWRSFIPGVATHDIVGDRAYDGDRLYLMKVKAGMKMPEHDHNGEEWTLILKGGYRVNGQRFTRGDLHVAYNDNSHAPEIEAGEDCICLVMTQGKLKMQSAIGRLLQPLLGI